MLGVYKAIDIVNMSARAALSRWRLPLEGSKDIVFHGSKAAHMRFRITQCNLGIGNTLTQHKRPFMSSTVQAHLVLVMK